MTVTFRAYVKRAGDGRQVETRPSRGPTRVETRQEEPVENTRRDRGRLQRHRTVADVHLRARQNPIPPVTGLTVQQQRQIAIAIKNSREMALLPYPGTTFG
jgi:Ribosomal protein S18